MPVDWRGNEWNEGDVIIYAGTNGNSPILTEAVVVDIQEVRKDYTYRDGLKIVVQPIISTNNWRQYSRSKDTCILKRIGTITKVGNVSE